MEPTADLSPQPPIASATIEELTGALAGVIADGLPVKSAEDAGLLLNLRSAYARAVIPSEPRSRLQSLNELLPRLIAAISDGDFREATQILFGLAPGTRGRGLMDRRRQAADRLGYSAGHFRNEVEADVLHAVAAVVEADLLRYQSRVQRAAESLEPTGDTPRLDPEHVTHEEELISRIWQHLYGLRAEMIAVARLSAAEGFDGQAADHRQAAVQHEALLRLLLKEYVDTYGHRLLKHGEVEFDALSLLSSWRLL